MKNLKTRFNLARQKAQKAAQTNAPSRSAVVNERTPQQAADQVAGLKKLYASLDQPPVDSNPSVAQTSPTDANAKV